MTVTNLPFSPTTESLANWLDTLTILTPANAANQLHQALKQLKSDKSDASELFPLYLHLTPPCLLLANNLSPLKLADADYKLNSKSIKAVKLVIQLLRYLISGFCGLAENKRLHYAQRQTAIFYALQLMGYCLRNYHLLYEMPSNTLWKQSANLYRLAVEMHCLNEHQSPKLPEFTGQFTISAILKRNILFSLFIPTYYSAPEINHLYQLANQHYDLLDLSTDHTANFDFYWNLEGEPPCAIKRISRYLPEGFLAISCRRFADALQQNLLKTPLKSTTQAKLALSLSGYEELYNSTLIGSTSVYQLQTGFKPICQFFLEQDKLAKILKLSTGGKPQARRLGLIPMDRDKDYFESRFVNTKSALPSKKINLVKTTSDQYAVLQSRDLDYCAGDIALLYKENQPASLAIIRQLTKHKLTGETHALVEFIHGNCSIFAFINEAGVNMHVLIIGGDTDTPEAFLPPDKYSVDTQIALNVGMTLHLQACIEHNTSFARFKIGIIDS